MVRAMIETHGLDAGRVFITGLSAGGAMTSVMLATYPEMFAGGGIIAGIPFGAANDVRDALESMRSAPLHTPAQWGDMVRAACDYHGPRPKISVWHGALDTTVNINNSQAILAQWADLHGLPLTIARQELVDGAIHLSWSDRLEAYTLAGLGHGTPIASSDLGQPGPFIIEAGISSTRRIAQFWGLKPSWLATLTAPARAEQAAAALLEIEMTVLQKKSDEVAKASTAPKMENLIWRALKAVGIFRP
jgi:feruloyl esterase